MWEEIPEDERPKSVDPPSSYRELRRAHLKDVEAGIVYKEDPADFHGAYWQNPSHIQESMYIRSPKITP